MASGVQLNGQQRVVEAYNNVDQNNADPICWAIFSGKRLMHKGAGDEDLTAFVSMLAENATSAIYTIKFYEDITDPKQVKEKTEASGSLNFRLDVEDFKGAGANNQTYVRKLEERIGLLETGTVLENEQPQTLQGAIMGLIAKPLELIEVINAIKGLLQPAAAPALTQGQPYTGAAALGNITRAVQNNEVIDQQEKIVRMQNAVTVLDEFDPKLCEHLEALAKMAKENPAQLNLMMAMM